MKIEISATIVTAFKNLNVPAGTQLIVHNGMILGVYEEPNPTTKAFSEITVSQVLEVLAKAPSGLNARMLADELKINRGDGSSRDRVRFITAHLMKTGEITIDRSLSYRFPNYIIAK